MKKICEIYDISNEYNMSENSVIVIISDLSDKQLLNTLPELNTYKNRIMTSKEWCEFLEINNLYNNNENKHRMREIRKSKIIKAYSMEQINYDDISNVLENDELKERIEYALSFLKEQPKRRFIQYYYEHFTYRQIADLEDKQVSSIYESIQTAKKLFLKKFYEYPKQNTPNKCK